MNFLSYLLSFLLLVFWMTLSMVAGAIPWLAMGGIGLLIGTGLGSLLNWLIPGSASARVGILIVSAISWTVLSLLYGMKCGWQRWWLRHSDYVTNPFTALEPAALGLSAPPEPDRYLSGAESCRRPAAVAGAIAGATFGILGALGAWLTGFQWEGLVVWSGAGAIAMAIEGAIMGAVLGAKRLRRESPMDDGFELFELSLGEWLGPWLAGTAPGPQSARGWSIGYAVDGLFTGAIAGTIVGAMATLSLQAFG